MLKLNAPLKDYIWGGKNLKEYYGKTSSTNVAESWELSTHADGLSVIAGGKFDGMPLCEVLKSNPCFYQQDAATFDTLPILFKLIDSDTPLSVQVHPDDSYAQSFENSLGKTECWYILEATEDAYIYLGLNRDISKEEFEEKIKNGTVESVLNRIPVHPGEIYYIPSRVVHAIGKGVTLGELQQSSNITYRVYDYNRLGKDGKPRQLHIQKALDVILFKKGLPDVPTDAFQIQTDTISIHNILKTDLFYLDGMELSGTGLLKVGKYFCALTCTDGNMELTSGNESLSISKGDTVFLCAGEQVQLFGKGHGLLYGTSRS